MIPRLRIINPGTETHSKAWTTVQDLMSFSVSIAGGNNAFVQKFNELVGFLMELGSEGNKIVEEASVEFMALLEQYKLLPKPEDEYHPCSLDYVHKQAAFAKRLKERVFILCPLTTELYYTDD